METSINVSCAGAVKAALLPLMKKFEEDCGYRSEVTFGSTGAMQERVASGAKTDLVVLNRSSVTRLAELGKVEPASMADVGQVGVAIAVRTGAPHPDISSEHALRAALLATPSLTFGDPSHGDSSGIHFSNVLKTMGLTESLGDRILLAPLGLAVVEYVQQGKAALGATQSSVILAGQGVEMVGLLPRGLQQLTTYTLGLTAEASAAARRFATYLQSAYAREVFANAGFAQPRD